MAATNWTIIRKNKRNNAILLDKMEHKWTYKQALAVAKESATDAFELICVIESSKILLKDEKENEKNCALQTWRTKIQYISGIKVAHVPEHAKKYNRKRISDVQRRDIKRV